MRPVRVGQRIIGAGHPTFVIAEIGINHNGDVGLAKEMTAAAWESGADAVKIQTFITRDFLHPSHPGYQYDIDAEIPHAREQEVWDYARQRGICLFSTPEELKSLEFIRAQAPPIIKIAAMDFNYRELVQAAARLHIPIIVSSGMADLEETLRCVRWVKEAGNQDPIVLHCVSCYPAPPASCNLSVIPALQEALSCPVGFSDHTIGIHIALAAITLGANVIEKHFTIDKNMPGPDQRCSMDPSDLRSLVAAARDIESAIGHGRKQPATEESVPRRYKRRGVYAARPLAAGVPLCREDVVFFAPSTEGSLVTDWPNMERRIPIRDIPPMACIRTSDLR